MVCRTSKSYRITFGMLVNLPEKVCKFWQSKGSRAEIRDRFFPCDNSEQVYAATENDAMRMVRRAAGLTLFRETPTEAQS